MPLIERPTNLKPDDETVIIERKGRHCRRIDIYRAADLETGQ